MPTHGNISIKVEDQDNLLACRISKKISTMHQSSSYIHRVPKKFCFVSKDTYEPHIVSIGPYHRGKKNLKAAQKYKTWYLDSLISRNPCFGLKVYVKIIREIESDIRECYAELINLTSNELVEMMILDGCFILELFYKYNEEKSNMESTDCLFSTTWMVPSLRRDMVLLENQIPFIVLEKLFTLLKSPTQILSLNELILDFFDPILPTILITQLDDNLQGKHLLDLLRNYLLHQTQALDYRNKPIEGDTTNPAEFNPSHIIDIGDHPTWEFTTCATNLHKGGLKFVRKETAHCLLDITFTSDGEVEMPPFCVGESWSVLFPNLIVLEQCRRDYPDKITSYVILINKLINSQEDVKVLYDQGIIDGLIMKDEKIVQVINKLSDGVVLDNFYYDGLCSRVNSYSRVQRNRQALLKNEFFRTPWVFISFVVALVLLLLVSTHTLFPN
ncbi:hypothetical protein ACHQM5_007465 [Ranunculus cassubicifolius]